VQKIAGLVYINFVQSEALSFANLRFADNRKNSVLFEASIGYKKLDCAKGPLRVAKLLPELIVVVCAVAVMFKAGRVRDGERKAIVL
jgi:hypothetical protein